MSYRINIRISSKLFRTYIYIFLLSGIILFFSCGPTIIHPFSEEKPGAIPDYSLTSSWSALPFQEDFADEIPRGETWVSDALKTVDVFFVYPTIYNKGKQWTADIEDEKLNKKIDKSAIRFQASPFNRDARVYAPRYRQAILHSFIDDTGNGKQALDFAYQDVKNAFDYYLENYNDGRPIILASHSQGTYHARRLLDEYFDDPLKKQQLVCAYLVGFSVEEENLQHIPICEAKDDLHCYVTWASYRRGFQPKFKPHIYDFIMGEQSVNPVTWTLDTIPVQSEGGILLNIQKKKRFKSEVQVKDNILWVKTKTPVVRYWNNLHVMDFNLFWHNIRENVSDRVGAYWDENPK